MNKLSINYVVSLGKQCHTAQFLKDNGLKTCSYPFDWVFSWHQPMKEHIIIDALKNNFSIFLDQSHYELKSNNTCTHKIYGKDLKQSIFLHRNPIEKDVYEYYKRCVDRLYKLMEKSEKKLFIVMNTNNRNKYINEESIKYLNSILKKHTQNYEILFVTNIISESNNYKYKKNDNIHILDIYTTGRSNGRNFNNKNDNVYFKQIIFSIFNFDIKDLY
jgi:hypothetical protein